jgi:protein-S-isoprenylcysteine O-methyltransferase Ste14
VGKRAREIRTGARPRIKPFLTRRFWTNAPIPEAFVAGLSLGGILHLLAARPIAREPRWPRLTGLALVPAGLGLILWAMAAAEHIRIDRPAALIAQGPYAVSRNPMYLGWALACLGLALLANSRWLLGATGAAGLYLHGREIPREEAALAAQFGEEYGAYRQRTRRYL